MYEELTDIKLFIEKLNKQRQIEVLKILLVLVKIKMVHLLTCLIYQMKLYQS